jgi:hypothetical protein
LVYILSTERYENKGSAWVALGFFWATCAHNREKPHPDTQVWEIIGMGMGFSWVPVFLRAFHVTGFQVTMASGYG